MLPRTTSGSKPSSYSEASPCWTTGPVASPTPGTSRRSWPPMK
jgi:hypothetical protein